MKLYTEEQVIKVVNKAFWQDIDNAKDATELISKLKPIELPCDDEICDEAESIAHNYFVMQRNHYQGLEEGAKRMAYWLIEKITHKENGQ